MSTGGRDCGQTRVTQVTGSSPIEGDVMRRPRLAVLAGTVAAALALTGCGGGSDSGGGTAAGKLEGTGPITFVTGKDTSGYVQKQVDAWNKLHPDERADVIELPESADAQRQEMVKNAVAKSDTYSVLNLDVVWTAEFAANGWVEQLNEADFPLDKMLAPTVETGKYFGRLYAVPITSDGGLLYYRKDLLAAAGVTAPPTTWADLRAACTKVRAANPKIGCFAGQFDKYEGLTVNFSEAVNSAGGTVVKDGKPTVDTPAARKGLDFLVNGFTQGYIPRNALTFKEEEGRRAFQAGQLLFHRQWPYQYAKANATDGSSEVAGKFAVAPLPGLDGPGQSTLGGHNYAISRFTQNKKTALEFIQFMAGEERQRANLQATSQAPTWGSLYDDPALVEQYPYLPVLKESILKAEKRPEAVQYNDVSVAIQSAAYSALKGDKTSEQALAELQAKLETLIGK
jgi:multiple sugar transport system substrate-binding protein